MSIVKLVVPSGEIRRIVLQGSSVTEQFAYLQSQVAELLEHGAEYSLTYTDAEGDKITLGQHAGELADALVGAEQTGKKLRLTVALRSAESPKPKPTPVVSVSRPTVSRPVKRPTGPRLTGKELLRRCLTYAQAANVKQQLRRRGKVCVRVAWEDAGRAAGSVSGPNVCDATLRVNKQNMPIIRAENYRDVTGDVPMHKMRVVVGNQRAGGLRRVSLSAVLRDLSLVTSAVPRGTSVFAARDTHFLAAPQTCLLPVAPRGHTDFNVRLRSLTGSVLTLLCTEFGTTAYVVNRGETMDLAQHWRGSAHMLRAMRLSEKRRQEGRPLQGQMTAREKAAQVVLVVQVPLLECARGPVRYCGVSGVGNLDHDALFQAAASHSAAPAPPPSFGFAAGPGGCVRVPKKKKVARSRRCESFDDDEAENEKVNGAAEAAQLRIGRRIGPFTDNVARIARPMPVERPTARGRRVARPSLGVLRRDERFPVRVTVQFYRCSGTGLVTPDDIDSIVAEQQRVFDSADFVGSLVTGEVVADLTDDVVVPPPDNWFDGSGHPVAPPCPGPFPHPGPHPGPMPPVPR